MKLQRIYTNHVPYFPYDFISMLPQRHLRVCVGPEASYAQC